MHIIGTSWHDGTPWLRVAQGGRLTDIPPAGDFDWQLAERTCTGYWHDHDGWTWHPCPDRAPVGHDAQCLLCFRGRGDPARRDDNPDCIFEPICKGNAANCRCSFGGVQQPVPHVVYCAFYGRLAKVGMTMERRVATRLREQGADAYFVIQRTPDRRSARQTEQAIAALTGLPEWRKHTETLPQWARAPDRNAIEAAAKHWISDLDTRYDVDATIHHIDHGAPLPAVPRKAHPDDHLAGTWVGARGPYWFANVAGALDVGTPRLLAIRRSDLIGRWID